MEGRRPRKRSAIPPPKDLSSPRISEPLLHAPIALPTPIAGTPPKIPLPLSLASDQIPPSRSLPEPIGSSHHASHQSLGVNLIKFLVLLHMLPLFYWLAWLMRSWRKDRNKTHSPKIPLKDVRKLRQLRRML